MYLSPQSPAALAARIAEIPLAEGEVVIVWVAERDAPDLPALVDALNAHGVPFCGGLYPGIVHAGRHRDAGLVAFAVPALGPPHTLRGAPGATVEGLAALRDEGAATAFVFFDGLMPNATEMLLALSDAVSPRVRYFGGGAGRLTFAPGPTVFTPDGAFAGGAVVLFSPLQIGMGIRHGWERFAGPFVATRAEHNRLEELNWDDAFSVYRHHVEPAVGHAITPETFLDAAKSFPLGVARDGDEDLVRNPYQTDGEALDCIGDIPAHAVLHILRSTPERIVDAAREAAHAAVADSSHAPHLSLLADCISRLLYLGDRFGDELDAVASVFAAAGAAPPDGILTMGEVSSSVRGGASLCNKTCTPALLGDAH